MEDKNKKLVSIIIPTYGRAGSLDIAIKSALHQSYRNIEIIVVDDNAEGSSERILTERVMEKYAGESRIKYYKHYNNQGVSAARNTGIEHASGEYIAFLDDDDRYMSKYIEKMLKRIVETLADMVYMPRAYCDDGRRVYVSKACQNKYPEGYIFEDVLGAKCPIGIFFMVKKAMLEKVGMFDIEMEGFEDGDVWFGISEIGKVAVLNSVEAIYTRDNRERLTKNPYKWEKDLRVFKEKWQSRLTEEEKQIFQEFIAFHENQNRLNMIFGELLGRGKAKAKGSVIECLKINIPISVKIRLILVKFLGGSGDRLYDWLRLSLCKNRFLFLEER